MTHEQMINTFLIFMICLAAFAVIRELICWYFKINKRVELQEKMLEQLTQINSDNKKKIHEKFLHRWVTDPNSTLDINNI